MNFTASGAWQWYGKLFGETFWINHWTVAPSFFAMLGCVSLPYARMRLADCPPMSFILVCWVGRSGQAVIVPNSKFDWIIKTFQRGLLYFCLRLQRPLIYTGVMPGWESPLAIIIWFPCWAQSSLWQRCAWICFSKIHARKSNHTLLYLS